MTANQNIRLVNVPGSAGAFVLIRASINCRKVTLIEDGSANGGAGQGIQYFVPDPFDPTQTSAQPAAWDTILPATEPLVLGGENSFNASYGVTIGNGPQDAPGAGVPPFLGTPLIWARSNSATATTLRVTESI